MNFVKTSILGAVLALALACNANAKNDKDKDKFKDKDKDKDGPTYSVPDAGGPTLALLGFSVALLVLSQWKIAKVEYR